MDPVNANGIRLRSGGPHAGRLLFTATHNAYQGDIIVYSDDGSPTAHTPPHSLPPLQVTGALTTLCAGL